MSPGGTVRAFIALELDGGLREAIGNLQARLRPRLGGIRLVRPEGIHLTLRFLGDTLPSQVDALRPLLAAAAASCPPTLAQVAGLGTFPERGSPRVLWLGLAVEAAILDLQRACERAARAAGMRVIAVPPEHLHDDSGYDAADLKLRLLAEITSVMLQG